MYAPALALSSPRSRTAALQCGRGGGGARADLAGPCEFHAGSDHRHYNDNTRRAIAAYQALHGEKADGVIGPATWKPLNTGQQPALIAYTITPQDVAGPFQRIPQDMDAKAKLKTLGYESPLDELSERFHSSPELLQATPPAQRR